MNFRRKALRSLARLGAFNELCDHRRSALWEVEREIPQDDNLYFDFDAVRPLMANPLAPMNPVERLTADYRTQGITTGPHPMRLARPELPDVWRACDVITAKHGSNITIAGVVICRQRPGTARGVVFISLEDETGVANAVVSAQLFERERLTITQEGFLRITGQIQADRGLPTVQAQRIERLVMLDLERTASHDFPLIKMRRPIFSFCPE